MANRTLQDRTLPWSGTTLSECISCIILMLVVFFTFLLYCSPSWRINAIHSTTVKLLTTYSKKICAEKHSKGQIKTNISTTPVSIAISLAQARVKRRRYLQPTSKLLFSLQLVTEVYFGATFKVVPFHIIYRQLFTTFVRLGDAAFRVVYALISRKTQTPCSTLHPVRRRPRPLPPPRPHHHHQQQQQQQQRRRNVKCVSWHHALVSHWCRVAMSKFGDEWVKYRRGYVM